VGCVLVKVILFQFIYFNEADGIEMSQTTFFLSLLPCELLFVFVPRHTGWRVGVMVCGCCTIHSARDGMLLLCSAAFCGCHLLGSESAFISHDTFCVEFCVLLNAATCIYLGRSARSHRYG